MSAHLPIRPQPLGQLTRRRAFTMVELIATMTILSAIGTATAFILFTALDGHATGTVQADLYRDGSTALDRMVRTLRDIPTDDTAATTAVDIDRVETDNIEFGDGEAMTLIGDDLMLNDGSSSHLLCEDVSSVVFTALDDDRQPLVLPCVGDACDAIQRVQVELTLSRHGEVATLRTLVHLRGTMVGADGL